jgi:hypothetical protein
VADQAAGTVETAGTGAVSSAHAANQHLEHNPGRPISWIGVTIAIVGSVVGGWAWMPPFAPPVMWPMFYAGCAVFVVGLFVIAGAKTMSKDWY